MNNTNRNNEEEKRLVTSALHGDTSAFGLIIRNTERLVAQIVFKMISHPEDRKDIAQDIYLKAWKKLPGFRFESKLSTWIAHISYTTCIDHLRKRKLLLMDNDQGEDGEQKEEQFFGKLLHHTDNDPVTDKELNTILKEEIEKLPPVYKTVITLFHQEELSYEEIGQVTGLPDGTIKSYLFRARKTLKNSLLATYKKEDL